MALPDTILAQPGLHGNNPVHKSSGGNYYAVIFDATNTHIEVWKSTDPGTAAWSEQDSTNHINRGAERLSSIPEGDIIHIVTINATDYLLKYHRFNMSTDAWDTTNSDNTIADLSGKGAPLTISCDINWRNVASDELVITANGLVDTDMGTDYDRLDLWHGADSGTPSWTGPVAFGPGTADEHEWNGVMAPGTANGMHLGYAYHLFATGSDRTYAGRRTFTSSNTLSTHAGVIVATNSNLSKDIRCSRPVSYDSSGTQKFVHLIGGDTYPETITWNEDGSGHLTTPIDDRADVDTSGNASLIYHDIVEDAGTLYVIYQGAGSDLYYAESTDDGTTWGTATEEIDAITVTFLSAEVLDTGKIALLYDDGGTTKYTEISIGGGLTAVSNNSDLRWHMEGVITNTATFQWDALVDISQASDLRWDLLTDISQTGTLQWDTLALVSQPADLRWHMEGVITNTATFQWDALVDISQTGTLQWDALVDISQVSDLRWDVLAAASNTSDLRWDALAAVNQVSDLRWDALVDISQASDLRWDLLAALGQSADLRWHMEGVITNIATLQWDALVDISQASDLRWDLLTDISQSADLRWNMLAALSQTTALQWSAIAEVAQSSTLQWDLQAGLSAVSNTSDLRWDLLAAVAQALDSRWDLLASVGITSDLRWDLLNSISQTLSPQWNSLAAASNQLDSRWDVIARVNQLNELRWDLMQDVAQALAARWSVLAGVSQAADLRWHLTGLVTDALILQWGVGDTAPPYRHKHAIAGKICPTSLAGKTGSTSLRGTLSPHKLN